MEMPTNSVIADTRKWVSDYPSQKLTFREVCALLRVNTVWPGFKFLDHAQRKGAVWLDDQVLTLCGFSGRTSSEQLRAFAAEVGPLLSVTSLESVREDMPVDLSVRQPTDSRGLSIQSPACVVNPLRRTSLRQALVDDIPRVMTFATFEWLMSQIRNPVCSHVYWSSVVLREARTKYYKYKNRVFKSTLTRVTAAPNVAAVSNSTGTNHSLRAAPVKRLKSKAREQQHRYTVVLLFKRNPMPSWRIVNRQSISFLAAYNQLMHSEQYELCGQWHSATKLQLTVPVKDVIFSLDANEQNWYTKFPSFTNINIENFNTHFCNRVREAICTRISEVLSGNQ